MIGIDLRPLQDPIARGVSSYTRPLVEELIRQEGTDAFKFFTAGTRGFASSDLREASPRIRHLRLPSKLINLGMAGLGYPQIDKYLGTETVFMPNINFWSVSKKSRLALTVHDLSFLVEPNWYSPKDRLWHRIIGAVSLIKRADRIIALSQHTARELNDLLNIPADKISVTPPGIPPLPQTGTTALPYPYVLFVGVVEPRKNIAIALKAFELLAQKNKDVHFVIAGHCPNNQKPTTKNPERIHFLGQVSAQEKTGLMKNARVLFFPSLYEGFGFPALEAMSLGVPVVASSAGALPETVGNAGALLDPADVSGFAAALGELCDGGGWRDTLIARGFERVKLFSWEKCAQNTLKILRNA